LKTAHYKLLFTAENNTINPEIAARKLNIQVNTVKKYLKALMDEGLIEPSGPGLYRLTDKGRMLLESIIKSRKSGEKYIVTNPATGEPLPLTFSNYEQLLAIYKNNLAPVEVLEEHLRRGYLTAWVKSIGDTYLAELLEKGVIRDSKNLVEYLEKIVEISREYEAIGEREKA